MGIRQQAALDELCLEPFSRLGQRDRITRLVPGGLPSAATTTRDNEDGQQTEDDPFHAGTPPWCVEGPRRVAGRTGLQSLLRFTLCGIQRQILFPGADLGGEPCIAFDTTSGRTYSESHKLLTNARNQGVSPCIVSSPEGVPGPASP